MEQLLMQTYTIALPILLGYIVWLLKSQTRDRNASKKGTMLLLRMQLIECHDRYMEQGYISTNAYENFCKMYEVYHELDEDATIVKIKLEIENLKLTEKGK